MADFTLFLNVRKSTQVREVTKFTVRNMTGEGGDEVYLFTYFMYFTPFYQKRRWGKLHGRLHPVFACEGVKQAENAGLINKKNVKEASFFCCEEVNLAGNALLNDKDLKVASFYLNSWNWARSGWVGSGRVGSGPVRLSRRFLHIQNPHIQHKCGHLHILDDHHDVSSLVNSSTAKNKASLHDVSRLVDSLTARMRPPSSSPRTMFPSWSTSSRQKRGPSHILLTSHTLNPTLPSQVTWVATSPRRCYEWPKGMSNISGDSWHVTVAVTSGVMPLLHRYFFKISQKV